jgi:hypothetical protein
VAPGISALARDLTVIFNTYLATTLDTFPNLNLFRFDTFALLQEVVTSPAAFGLTNVTDRCYTGDDLTFTGGGTICDTPETFLFWDGIHPTATAHTLLGDHITEAIGLTRFDTFHVAKLEVAAGAFEVKGSFTLGAEGDGIHPVNEEVTLQVGTYVVMLPPGSFTSRRSHGVARQFKFEGFIDGGALEVRLDLLGDDFFTFKIEGAGNPVSAPGDPLGVTFIIGNDTGVTSAFVDSHWGSHRPRR